jgi:hypothetical protein
MQAGFRRVAPRQPQHAVGRGAPPAVVGSAADTAMQYRQFERRSTPLDSAFRQAATK